MIVNIIIIFCSSLWLHPPSRRALEKKKGVHLSKIAQRFRRASTEQERSAVRIIQIISHAGIYFLLPRSLSSRVEPLLDSAVSTAGWVPSQDKLRFCAPEAGSDPFRWRALLPRRLFFF